MSNKFPPFAAGTTQHSDKDVDVDSKLNDDLPLPNTNVVTANVESPSTSYVDGIDGDDVVDSSLEEKMPSKKDNTADNEVNVVVCLPTKKQLIHTETKQVLKSHIHYNVEAK